tara:strand:+ start:1958 stop:2218 length:261 start_codon:yes stop_codon:yes gene_type:complete
MKMLAALTLTAAACFVATPVHANPVTDAMQQLAANQLAEIKITVVQQARQAVDKTATELRQLFVTAPAAPEQKELVAKALPSTKAE